MTKPILWLLCLLFALTACKSKSDSRSTMESAFAKAPQTQQGSYDLEDIQRSGELIIATLSGPDTYYDYHGMPMGEQYALAEDFASTEGLRVRVEVATDTLRLLHLLETGQADLVALPVSQKLLQSHHLQPAGFHTQRQQAWAVKKTSEALAHALDEWYQPDILTKVQKSVIERVRMVHHVTRRAQAVYLSRSRGIISIYDHLFKQAAATTGWDWRLIAAQAYQESAFDPNARSWAGAQGLMQLMPRTAADLGIPAHELNNPERNVAGAAQFIRKLTTGFADIRDGRERIKFVLAAYNGGVGHVRDAMALARRYGKDPQRWDQVAPYILALQQPAYYRDPVVKYGYMIGAETEGYVRSILQRYQGYGGDVMLVHQPTSLPATNEAPSTPSSISPAGRGKTAPRKNKYSSGLRMMSPDDPEFNQMHP
jgi:extracellular solute-binding protein, family 3